MLLGLRIWCRLLGAAQRAFVEALTRHGPLRLATDYCPITEALRSRLAGFLCTLAAARGGAANLDAVSLLSAARAMAGASHVASHARGSA